jgi:uncharacterized protein YjbI with pentapeptide repeats
MKTIISSLFAAAFVLSASLSMAADPAHVEQLKLTGKCIKCDLRGAFMFGANLYRADLRGANLRDADLRRANLSLADLRGADLRGADLRGALFCGAIMPDGQTNDRNCGY